jgi:osmotically-inducible protein OsmY
METKSKAKHSGRLDDDIARDIRQAMKLDNDIPDGRIRVDVQDGRVTLEGNVDTLFQREAAEADAKKVKGTHSVANRIEVQSVIRATFGK